LPKLSIFPAIPNLNMRDKYAALISNATEYVMDQDCDVEVRNPYVTSDYGGKYKEGDSSRVLAITDRINACIDAFCESDATHLWLIDADIEVPRHALRTLLNLNADVASGIYCFHNDPAIMMFGRAAEGNPRMFKPRGLSSWTGVTLGENERVGGGNGCMLIRRRVFDIYNPAIKSLRFVHAEQGGSDLFFWYRCQEAGFKCRITGNVLAGHTPYAPLKYYESEEFKVKQREFAEFQEEAKKRLTPSP